MGKEKLAEIMAKSPEELKTQADKKAKKLALKQLEMNKKKAEKAKNVIKYAKDNTDAIKTLNNALKDGKPSIVTQDILDSVPAKVREYVESKDIIFKPNPGPQSEFLAATEKEVFFGGSRGGGKSMAMIVDPLRYADKQAHRALILRRTMPESRDLQAKAQFLYPRAYPGAKFKEQEKEWRFPSGARIEFGYAESMSDALRYQGQSYSGIYVDELCQFPTPDVWNFLRSSLRSADPTLPTYMRASGNPGNIGSNWVKQMFIDPSPPNKRFEIHVEASGPRGVIKETISRRFIPSTVYDNAYLLHDNSYIAMLASLPEVQKRQFLYGEWDCFEGSAFSEFRRDIHVVEPFNIPNSWPRARACDFGYASWTCCLWFAIDPDNTLIFYRELYTRQETADVLASHILELEKNESIRYGILDASTWANRGDRGPSIAEAMQRAGCRWTPSDRSANSRRNGKLEMHRRLAVNPRTGKPGMVFFPNCLNIIKDLPQLPLDPNNVEDVDTKCLFDHSYDACRYAVMSRPMAHDIMYDNSNHTRKNVYTPVDSTFGY